MKDYTNLGLGQRMVRKDSLAGRPRDYTLAVDQNVQVEPTPFLNRTAVAKGTLSTTLGGITEIRDSTGGTVLFTINPDTGVVTIAGSVVAQVGLNLGTISDSTIAGQSTLAGTLTNNRLINSGTYNNGTLGTPAITGGTINNTLVGTPAVTGGTVNSVFQSSGVAGTAGSIVYVKTVDYAGSLTTFGTLNFAGGIITSHS